jgi:2,4-dienoyl-CoA reductase-like NADH-dependent reductase (Old Yellow Enzyme family)
MPAAEEAELTIAMTVPLLFQPLQLRSLELRNRVVIAPMGTYTAHDGLFNDWHHVHYGKLAQGGAGLVFVEATAVAPEGRVTHGCAGLWSDAHVAPLRRIVDFARSAGVAVGNPAGSWRPQGLHATSVVWQLPDRPGRHCAG